GRGRGSAVGGAGVGAGQEDRRSAPRARIRVQPSGRRRAGRGGVCPIDAGPRPGTKAGPMRATVHVLRQVDVGDSVHLEEVAKILRSRGPGRGAALLRGPETAAGAGVVLRNEPLDLGLGQVACGSFTTDVRARIFDFGAIAIRFTFSLDDPTPEGLVEVA